MSITINSEFGRALEREIRSQWSDAEAGSMKETILISVWQAIRAALNAWPQKPGRFGPGTPDRLVWADNIFYERAPDGYASWMEWAQSGNYREAAVLRKDVFNRLRARDKWIEEHAKPALEAYGRKALNDGWHNSSASEALSALPQDPQGGVR